MIKTEFMQLLEELDRINEGIEDIDFNALTAAEEAAESLSKEIREFEREYNSKVSAATKSDEAYAKLSGEIYELEKQLRELQDSYWVRTWYEVAPGDWEHDDEIDEVAYAKVKDRVEELAAEIKKMKADLADIKAKIASQFDNDMANINTKKADREKHMATSKDIKGQLAQAYVEAEPEITSVVNRLNAIWEGDKDKLIWKADPKSFAYDKKGRVLVRLYTNIRDDSDDYDYDDFKESGEMTEDAATTAAENVAEYAGAYPEQIADVLELETSEDGWYSIPDSVWELDKEAEVYATETPEMTDYESWEDTYWEPGGSDWTIQGSLKVEVSIYIGKKVK